MVAQVKLEQAAPEAENAAAWLAEKAPALRECEERAAVISYDHCDSFENESGVTAGQPDREQEAEEENEQRWRDE